MMVKEITFALRTLLRDRLLSAINIVGLSVGIGACLIIFLIIDYELGYDTFHPDGKRIYRVYSLFRDGNNAIPGISTGMANFLSDNLRGVESLTHFHTLEGSISVAGPTHKSFGNYNGIALADTGYFEVFKVYNWLAGNRQTALSRPFQVVLTESRARLYFGEVSPLLVVGKEITYLDSLQVTVSGVIKDLSEKSDLFFTDFISRGTIDKSWLKESYPPDSWNALSSGSQFFIKLSKASSPEEVASQLAEVPILFERPGLKWEDWRPLPMLQALEDIHFSSELGIFDHSRSVMEKRTLHTLVGIALLLLLLAIINFVNLETAQLNRRSREVGVRKILGSSRARLVFRFLLESFFLCLFATILSIVWVELAFGFMIEFIPEGLYFRPGDPSVLTFLGACILTVTLLAGIYPAFLLSLSHPVTALKNHAFQPSGAQWVHFRKGLTVIQFSITPVLLIGALVVALQVKYMVNKDLGFDPDCVVYVSFPEDGKSAGLRLRDEFAMIPEIEAFGLHMTPPVSSLSLATERDFDNGKEILKHKVYDHYGDTTYLRVYGIKLLAGRNVLPTDSVGELLINETYMRLLGFTDPRNAIGQFIGNAAVVGVVKDFHTASLHALVKPAAICYQEGVNGLGVRVATPENSVADLAPALAKMEEAWKKIYPESNFEPYFMSERIRQFYENERRAGKLAVLSTILALVISGLGLFASASFTVTKRTREIGVRKILGASVEGIALLLTKDFLVLVLIGFAIGAPVAFYFGARWLENFPYRIELSPSIFFLALFAMVVVALITVSLKTLAAAASNPVESLRHE